MDSEKSSMADQIAQLAALDGHKEEQLESAQLEESRQEEKITTIGLLDDYTDLEKKKYELEKEMKQFLLDNKMFASKMADFKRRQDELDNQQNEIKTKLVTQMPIEEKKNETNGIFKVVYVAPTTKSTFDTKKFKAENEVLYDKYVNVSNVSAYVKISKA